MSATKTRRKHKVVQCTAPGHEHWWYVENDRGIWVDGPFEFKAEAEWRAKFKDEA